tara:strand:+ start:127 stop:2676 length:2550 start_codon:yes stop_codon:yes gene_type:complete
MAITYTQTQTLTPDQYHNSFVNFYQQVLGIKGTYGGGGGGGDNTSDKQEETTTGVNYSVSSSDDDDTSPFVPGSSFVKSDGTMDINVMALDPKGIKEQIADSEAYGSKTFRNDRLNLFNLPDDSSLRKKITENLDPAVKGVFAGASSMGQTSLVGAGLTGTLMSSFIGGETYKDEMGNPQFDPTGNPVLSAMGQITRDARKDILTRIAAEAQANPAGDLGFAASIGNLMVVRGPGDVTYSGNRQGLSFQQIKNIEALSKGILPDTFRFEKDKDGQSGLFMGNKRINTGIEESGGVYLDPNNKQAGFYRADGAIYTHRFGYAPVGMMSDVETLAKNYFPGMDAKTARDLALSAIQNARAGSGTLQSNLRDAASSTIYNMDMDFLNDEDKDLKTKTPIEIAIAADKARKDSDDKPPVKPTSTAPTQKGNTQAQIDAAIAADKARRDSNKDDKGGGGGGGSKDDDKPTKKTESAQDFTEKKIKDYQSGNISGGFNEGGFIGMNVGGLAASKSGFVDGVPPSQTTDAQEVADDRPTQLPEGAFVLNASSVEFAGEQDISKMLFDAHEEAIRRGAVSQGTSGEATRKMIDVAVSRGEVVVAPYMVKIIGLDRLEKINKRGIRDTERKIEENGQELEGAALRRSFLSGGFLDSAVGLDSPTLTSPQGTEDIPLPDNSGMSKNNNMYFDYRFGDIKDAIRQVEIKGFEDQPYIFTGVKKKDGKASSAFGPMQITSSTLRDLKERSGDYEMFSDEIKDYVEKLIEQGDDKVNLELYGSIYRDEKRQTIGKDARNKLKGYGAGSISIDDHEKYYEVVSDATLKQKLLDHGTLEEALSSYGEGMEYASKVLKGLGISKN